MVSKIVLIVEYDGTRYHGFQWQTNAPTIQQEIESAITHITQYPLRVLGASRTDSGAHAKGQVICFRTEVPLPPATWRKALNFYLPEDIAVVGAYEAEDSFDVRRHAKSREYAYRIINRPSRSPLLGRFAHFVPEPLQVAAMQEACLVLLGEHDLASFCTSAPGSTVRTIFEARVRQELDMVIFEVVASSFLPHQIRNTVGGLIEVGRQKLSVERFRELALSARPGSIGPAVPACGLCLMRVNYPDFSPRGR